jgi:hypothetical protein
MVHTALGNHDAALEWVERVIEERANTTHLIVEPLLLNLRGDPRFVQRFEQIGLGAVLVGYRK